jgi:hypothetical protein
MCLHYVQLFERALKGGGLLCGRRRQSDAPGTSERLNSGESSTMPAHGDARPSALRVQEGSLDLGVLINREVRVVYPEPFSVRPNLEVRVESSYGEQDLRGVRGRLGVHSCEAFIPGKWRGYRHPSMARYGPLVI